MRPFTATRLGISLLAVSLVVAGCGGKVETMEEKTAREMYPHGSVLGTDGGFNLFGGNKRKGAQETAAAGIGVDAFLWRGSLDTLHKFPIASIDSAGGVILTDWFSNPEAPNERFKINCYILDRQLRADGVKVSVFKQVRDGSGWRDAAVDPKTSTDLEDAILTAARKLRIAQSNM